MGLFVAALWRGRPCRRGESDHCATSQGGHTADVHGVFLDVARRSVFSASKCGAYETVRTFDPPAPGHVVRGPLLPGSGRLNHSAVSPHLSARCPQPGEAVCWHFAKYDDSRVAAASGAAPAFTNQQASVVMRESGNAVLNRRTLSTYRSVAYNGLLKIGEFLIGVARGAF